MMLKSVLTHQYHLVFLEDTIIDDGTKISSQVYIGSGMKIGKNCMITPKNFLWWKLYFRR